MQILLPRRFRLFQFLLLFIPLGLTGCMRGVKIDGAWEQGAKISAPFERVILVGVTHDVDVRCNFELFLRTQVRGGATDAQASCNLMSLEEDLTREHIEAIVDDYHADAVIAVVLVNSQQGATLSGEADTRGGADYKAIGTGYADVYRGGFGVYGVPVVYGEYKEVPPVTTIDGKVTIRTLVYETDNATLVYEMETTAGDLYSRDQAMAIVSEPMAEHFRNEGLIH